MGANSAPACTSSSGKVSEVSGRGEAASTRGTRYIVLHPRHCAGFSAVRVSETLHSRAWRADDRTRRGRTAVVTMRSRVRYGIAGGFGRLSRNEHRILRLFRRTPISRFSYLELSVPNIFAVLSILPYPLAFLAYVSAAPLDPRLGPRRISHITFRNLHPLRLFLLRSPHPDSFVPNCTRARSRLSYLASFLDENLSCGTLAAPRAPIDSWKVGVLSRRERLSNFVYIS